MTFTEIIMMIFSGRNLAILGAALAAGLSGWGSAKGVSLVGEAASGMLSEDPSKFGKALALQALPMTQGIYGLVAAFLVIWKIGIFGDPVALTLAEGAYFLMACLPYIIVGYVSAIRQAKVSAAGINLIAKRPDELGKAITSSALVETYAIFALLITMLLIFNAPLSAI